MTTNPLTKDQIIEKLLQLVGVANMLALADEASPGRIDPGAVGSTGKLLASMGMEVLHALDHIEADQPFPL